MEKPDFEYKRTDTDESAEEDSEKAAAKGKFDQFSQPKTKNHILEEKLSELQKKYFDREFKNSQEETDAYHDFEIEQDELLDRT